MPNMPLLRTTMLAVLGLSLLLCRASAQDPYVGEIRMFAGNFAPRGWAFCDGQLLSIAQNTALFSLLGTTYGGNGQTTFALPDLRGRAPMHAGQGPGLTSRTLGEVGGAESVTLTIPQMPAHTDTLPPHNHPVTIPSNNDPHKHGVTLPAVPGHTHEVVLSGAAASSHNHTVELAASATTHSHDGTIPAWTVSHTHTTGSHTHSVAVNQISFTKDTVYLPGPVVSDKKRRGFTTPITTYTPTTTNTTVTTSPTSITLDQAQVSQPATSFTTKDAAALANGDLTLTTSSATTSIDGLSATTNPAGDQATATINTAPNTWSWAQGVDQVTTGTANAASGTPVGGGQPHDNMPPFLAINYIIALQGVFPPRN